MGYPKSSYADNIMKNIIETILQGLCLSLKMTKGLQSWVHCWILQNLSEGESASDQIGDAGRQYAMSELKRLDNMSEAEENLEMLRYLLKQSVILAKRVEKSNKSWYRY